MKKSEKRDQLVEQIGVNIEEAQQFSPLASRIYALVLLAPIKGYSFEDVVELSKSSKSSVSTNLKLLLESGVLEYFTKPGERKRYFRLSQNYLEVSLNKLKNRVAAELSLFYKIDSFNSEYNTSKYEKHKKIGHLYKKYLEAHHENLEATINEMNKLERTV